MQMRKDGVIETGEMYRMIRWNAGVTTRGGNFDLNVSIAFLRNAGYCEGGAKLPPEASYTKFEFNARLTNL